MTIYLAEEPFYSIQGEGPIVGKPCIFFRFTGCVLSCDFCDTKYAWWNKHKYKLEDYSRDNHKIHRLSDRYIITGGEPLMHVHTIEFKEFIKSLLSIGRVSFETVMLPSTGDIKSQLSMGVIHYMNKVDEIFDTHPEDRRYIISPKLDLSCYDRSYQYFNNIDEVINYYSFEEHQTWYNTMFFYKLVYKKEYEENILKLFRSTNMDFDRFYIMPFTQLPFDRKEYIKSCKETIEFCKKHGFIYSPRLQFDVYGDKKGV